MIDRALSLTQPWGWLVVQTGSDGKSIENRQEGFSYKSFRGPFYVHAAQGMRARDYHHCVDWVAQNVSEKLAARIPAMADLQRGGIIGSANVVGIVPPVLHPHERAGERRASIDYRWHMADQWGFELEERKALPFVPCKGALGFWKVPPEVLRLVRGPTTAAELALLLESVRLPIGSEVLLQHGIASELSRAGILFSREHQLSDEDRVDFLVGSVAVETKIKGGLSEVTRQLHRYAQNPEVTELLLVTSRMQLAQVPETLNGKPVRVAVQWGALL